MKQGLALIGIAAAAVGCKGMDFDIGQGPHTQGSGKLKSEARSVGSFSRIESSGSADCKVTAGKAVSVKIEADDNILPLIETTVKDGVLHINCKGSFSTKNDIRATITVPSLESFTTRGSGDSTIDGVKGKAFSASISGSGNIVARGQADRVSADIKGSGSIDLSGLRAREASASISGSGDIDVHASHSVDAAIRGSGDVAYAGNPSNVQKSISGSGDVHPR